VNLADLNWLDWLLIAALVLIALDGMRSGFFLGTLDLLAAALALAVAFIGERPVGNWLVQLFPSFEPALAHLVAFLALLVVVQVLVGATIGRLVLAIARGVAGGPLAGLDRVLGVLPGVVRGVFMLTLFLLPFALLPILPSVSQGIEQSRLANPLVATALEVMPDIEARLGQDIEGGLPGLVVAPPEPESETGRPLGVAPQGDLVPDPTAEQRMLELLNDERRRSGVTPVVADERLRQVARAHSLEMFQRNYFSHTSPTSGSPFDRMRAAGTGFLVAGENLAYAPNVEIAHRGLMNSPGHRANILRPEFGRVGIGVIRSPAQGSMFTQDFTN
jgi:uncharacterized membrane protein required for colicin V production